jgi:hypothetical protein
MYGFRGLKGIIGVEVGAKRLLGRGQLILSIRLVWREVRILAQGL